MERLGLTTGQELFLLGGILVAWIIIRAILSHHNNENKDEITDKY